ncbi:cilia- and flagella-associated protein 47 [Protobothrops mucrosquamatus]|uniref:cilia- and flagella-associated protein 47 n=1 Tax=Protobothrops mucrosquamatus TaxID=103944 RepID=UPI0007756B92|nr:cilia- and flagella-associated protein 47 [Protobothrops mucrosquamatus]
MSSRGGEQGTGGSMDVDGVRITPPELRFVDAMPGSCYRALLSVQNLQTRSCSLHLQPPERTQFKLIVENPKKPVASGLYITATVEYHPDSEEDLHDRLLLHVEKKVIEIPLIGLRPCCFLEIEPEINFGTVIANSKIIHAVTKITNYGSSPGTFDIKYRGSVPIIIAPINGVIEPKTVKLIKVEICTDVPKIINQLATVELQGGPTAEIKIKANIVEQVLEVLGVPHSNTIQCVNFGCVYFGTSKMEEIILHNKSPEPVDWVAVLMDNALGGEMGTDIQQSSNAALKDYPENQETDVSTLITCIPNEGTLQPYQKTVVFLSFSPKQLQIDRDFDRTPSRKDYAVFLKFEAVGSKDDFLHTMLGAEIPIQGNPHCVELGLIGSGLPVMLTFTPGPVVSFKECYIGEHTDLVCTLQNESDGLPVTFVFHKIAHYNICPEKGKIKGKSAKDVIFSFIPRHIGTFTVRQKVDIIGPVPKKDDFRVLEMKPFHQIHLVFSGLCKSVSTNVVLKSNPGLTPLISNATGIFIANKGDQLSDVAPIALLKSDKTQLHAHRINRNLSNVLVALPNDRPASIRPAEFHKDYRTIFTKVPRYCYIDPEFSYTVYEELEKQMNKDYYADYIHNLRKVRLNKKEAQIFKMLNNPVDIGLKPASGLKSPMLRILKHDNMEKEAACVNRNSLLTSKQLGEIESRSIQKEVNGCLNPEPLSQQEVEDCSLILTPKQLHKIVIGPSTIDFGEVCVHSTTIRKMHIINNLPVHIWIQIEMKSEELQQTNSLSHVITPFMKTCIPVVFERDTLGNFKKSFMYSINQHHVGHILVIAKIVPVALELSTRELTLNPAFSFLAKTGFRTTVTLYNRKNYPAQFTWKPVIMDNGMGFSICPEKGIVEASKDLECEVVWHPGFSSSATGEFDLCVHEGKTLRLKCFAKVLVYFLPTYWGSLNLLGNHDIQLKTAVLPVYHPVNERFVNGFVTVGGSALELGSTSVQFKEQRITVNNAPLHLTTCRTAILQNLGHNHAYFQVLDVNPVPGMIITPFQGVIPVGGRTEIKIYFRPNALMKFDSRVEVAIRNAKSLELRIGGSVEVPDIYISVCSFIFPGVYVNSTQEIPFSIENKGKSYAKVTIDLSEHDDFTLHFQPDMYNTSEASRVYRTTIEANTIMECSLNFTPKEVAAYDFILPIKINADEAQCSTNTSKKLNSASSAKHMVVPRPQSLTIPTQECKVQATVLQPPLNIYPLELTFQHSVKCINMGVISDSSNIKKLYLKNISKKQLTWRFDLDGAGKAVDDGIFKFSLHTGILYPGQNTAVTICFCPYWPGIYTAQLPAFLNDELLVYRTITLSGVVKSNKINFKPQLLILMPVPLNVKTGADVCIIPQDYLRPSVLEAEIPELDSGDYEGGGDISAQQRHPLTVDFPEGNRIEITPEGNCIGFSCRINFISSKPLSFLKNLFFVDEERNRFSLQVSATAENCLLTVYPYLACHLTNQQIVLESDSSKIIYSTGDTLQHPCYIPGTCIQSSSSIFDPVANSDYENSVSEETAKYTFFQKIVMAVQNWFTLFGWSKGPNPISIPYTLRRDICKIQMTSSDEKLKLNLGKDTKTIYDLLLHLSGQLLPGISSSQVLPFDPIQRVVQLHWQHSTMITFLKSQGASLSHIMPQFLLDFEDYMIWSRLQLILKIQKSDEDDNYIYVLDDSIFETVSKRAWTDVLLQIYKILILQRVSVLEDTGQTNIEDTEHLPKISIDPLSSNIYSSSERILLIWMNRHFEKTRKIVWKNCKKGDIPPTRWIVNFDRDLHDGLVLAAQLASYCPYLISTHFVNMYTHPTSSEQYLHNALILVNAFHAINLDIDIVAADICDPNPVMMLMLCVYLYERLPQYLPKKTLVFAGQLHATILRKVFLKNPSIRPLVYNATILGKESSTFSLPKGNTVTISPKSQVKVNVEFTSRFLYPAEAVLLLVSKALTGVGGFTMAFSLKTKINSVKPSGILKCKSSCYELKKYNLQVTSPFRTEGPFSSEAGFLKDAQDVIDVCGLYNQEENAANESNCLQEFFSPLDTVFVDQDNSITLDLHYLPFKMGKRYCVIILINEQIGEFLYLVEGICDLPLPSSLIQMDSSNILYINSTCEEMPPVLYLKCHLTDILREKLKIPLINDAREKALAIAAQQHMSALEYERRRATGTLESSSVRVAVAALGLSRVEKDALHNYPLFSEKCIEYNVEASMPECFEIPSKIYIPVLASSRVNSSKARKQDHWLDKAEDDAIELPLTFKPQYAGRYPCHILLESKYDVRLFKIECVVNTDTYEAELEFVTPAYQAVIQDIPITNLSQQDWKLKADLKGYCFYGPPIIYVVPGETTLYPLMFKPTAECVTMGQLTLQNEADGTDHIFLLKGIATKPLALDHIKIDCQVRQTIQKVIMVPNFTKNELIYKVSSDLSIVSGEMTLKVEPEDTAAYTLNISPWKRGKFNGIIVFVAEEREQQQYQQNSLLEEPDGVQYSQKSSTEKLETGNGANSEYKSSCCKVWFSLEMHSMPAQPEKTLKVECAVLDTIDIGIPITNPTADVLELDVELIDAIILSGENKLVLEPKETLFYEVKYSPATTGHMDGSVIFTSEKLGEFWYALKLKGQMPQPTRLPEVECELGKWFRQHIPLVNPTNEILELEYVNSNPGHFSMEINPKAQLTVAPHSTTEVSVLFCPSALGRTNHTASIIFKCPQLEEWVFYLSGIGRIPQPMEPASVSSCLSHHSSIIVNFKNPTFEEVVVNIILTDRDHITDHPQATSCHHSTKDSIFWLPLKETQGIFLPQKSKLDIPVLFAPLSMKLYETFLVIEVKKIHEENWTYDDTFELREAVNSQSVIIEDEKLKGLRWIYPIYGISEAPPSELAPAVVCCRARSRLEENIEVLLTGVVPGTTASQILQDTAMLTLSQSKSSPIHDEVQVTDGFSTTDEFMYEIQFESERMKSQLKSAIAINLVKKERDLKTGIVTLIFNIIFTPYKPTRNPATLVLQHSTGGIWKFPILFVVTDPEVDDVIDIEAIGLNKESVVSFKLTSQTRYPEPYTAYFLPGSDPEFTVSPQAGELLPLDTAGTCITVGFKPSMYSKKHKATLVIQTAAMQWMYEINGLLPKTIPPTSSAKVICRNTYMTSATVQQRNFVRENMKILSTSVSSPIKGAPLILRTK